MKKIIRRIDLYHLRNEAWFNFLLELKSLIEKSSASSIGIDALFAEFTDLLEKAGVVIEIIRKNSLSDVIVRLDGARDNCFRCLKSSWKASLFHPNGDVRAAAEELEVLFNHYGTVSRRPYNEETATIINLVRDLRGKYAPYSETVGLGEMIDELERANNDFETTVMLRNAEIAEKPDLKLLEIRREINRCFSDMVERIEALALLNAKDAGTDGFVKNLNANIERYKRNR